MSKLQEEASQFTFGVLTMSDSGSRGERQDGSGAFLLDRLKGEGYRQVEYRVVPDQVEKIAETLIDWVDNRRVDLIVTTGGTGVAPTDVTPEAMNLVLEKEIPGMAEAMRAASLLKTPRAVLSRGRAGIRGKSLIVNLPGSEKAARENIEVLLPGLVHALYKINGGADSCGG